MRLVLPCGTNASLWQDQDEEFGEAPASASAAPSAPLAEQRADMPSVDKRASTYEAQRASASHLDADLEKEAESLWDM